MRDFKLRDSICADLEDGSSICGETNIDTRGNNNLNDLSPIKQLRLQPPDAPGCAQAIRAVRRADTIVIGPGDLSVSAGCTSELTNPLLITIVSDCIRSAHQLGLHPGILVSPGPMLDAALKAGCDLAYIGGDVTQLASAWPKLLQSVISH